jgi:hypothetical protein
MCPLSALALESSSAATQMAGLPCSRSARGVLFFFFHSQALAALLPPAGAGLPPGRLKLAAAASSLASPRSRARARAPLFNPPVPCRHPAQRALAPAGSALASLLLLIPPCLTGYC